MGLRVGLWGSEVVLLVEGSIGFGLVREVGCAMTLQDPFWLKQEGYGLGFKYSVRRKVRKFTSELHSILEMCSVAP